MAFSLARFGEKAGEVEGWLLKELAAIRTSRATPAILDNIAVEIHGAMTPLRQIAAISVEDPRTLRIAPWDAASLKAVEKAVVQASQGFGVTADERGIRLTFPEITGERRITLMRVVKEKMERARIALRKARDETMHEIETAATRGGMGEDEKFRVKKELEKHVESANKKLQGLGERKEKEILS